MNTKELRESLEKSLEALEKLDVSELADMIYKWGPPSKGWALGVYMKDGEVLFTDYYQKNTVITSAPDEVFIAIIDNTQGHWEPKFIFGADDSLEISDELVSKYKGNFDENIDKLELRYRIWNELATPEEKDQERARMIYAIWHREESTHDYLQKKLEEARERAHRQWYSISEIESVYMIMAAAEERLKAELSKFIEYEVIHILEEEKP